MKKLLLLLIPLLSFGCASVETYRDAGLVSGEIVTDVVCSEYGFKSNEARELRRVGEALDRAAYVLASDDPLEIEEIADIRRALTGLESANDTIWSSRVARTIVDAFELLRVADRDAEARTKLAMMLEGAARSIHSGLKWWAAPYLEE